MNRLSRNFIKSNLSLRVYVIDFNIALRNVRYLGLEIFVIAIFNEIPASDSTFLSASKFSLSHRGNGRKGGENDKIW